MKLRTFEAFFGYKSQSMALSRYRGDYENVGGSEIDESAILAACSVHCEGEINYPEIEKMLISLNRMNIGLNFKTGVVPWEKMLESYQKKGKLSPKTIDRVQAIYRACILTKNMGDISRINPLLLPDMDLFTYSFPCQDISMAGKQKGFIEGSETRSSLLWECQKIVELKRPPYLMMENVKNLVGKKHKEDFDRWLKVLEVLGYKNYWKVINAKWCGIPQNRERVFCVSILKEHDNFNFHFYDDFDSGVRLKDILESEVDEKYYMSEEKTGQLIKSLEAKGYEGYEGYERSFYPGGKSYCIDSNYHKGISPNFGGAGRRTHVVEKVGSISKKDYPNNKNQRLVVSKEGIYPTVIKNPDKSKILMVGRINKSQDGKIVSPEGISFTHSGGHNNQPKIVETNKIKKLVGETGGHYGGGYYDKDYLSPTLVKGGSGGMSNNIPGIIEACRITGRNPDNPKSRESGIPTVQMLEINKDPNTSNCLTTVQKDTMILERPKFRIRKLTPTECFRLMAVSDTDIKKIISTGLANSQLYKMAGNSIVVDCMKFLEQLKPIKRRR